MEHQAAIETAAAERYLLGEMAETEREQFEAHFFDCSTCAADVRELGRFQANLRALPQWPEAAPEAGFWQRWFGWLTPAVAAPALASLLLVVGLQTTLRPGAPSPARAAEAGSYLLLRTEARGETPSAGAASAGPMVVLLDLAGIDVPSQCLVKVGTQAEFTAQAPAPGEPLALVLSRSSLTPGDHPITILHPQTRAELARYPFRMR